MALVIHTQVGLRPAPARQAVRTRHGPQSPWKPPRKGLNDLHFEFHLPT